MVHVPLLWTSVQQYWWGMTSIETRTFLAVECTYILIWDMWRQVYECAEETSVLLNTPDCYKKLPYKQLLCSVCVNTVWPGVRDGYALDDLTCLLSHPMSSSSPWEITGVGWWGDWWVGQLNVSRCVCRSVPWANWHLLPGKATD